MTKEKEKDYVIVAKELNKLFGLEPSIDLKATEKTVIGKITEAAELVEPEDELTDLTKTFLEKLKVSVPVDKEVPEKIKKPAPEKPVKPEKIPGSGEGKSPVAAVNPKVQVKKNKKTENRTAFDSIVGGKAGRIDDVFLQNEGKEIDVTKIMKEADVIKSRVKVHIKDLINKKGIDITSNDKGGYTYHKK